MSMTGGLSTGLTRGLTGGLGGYGSSAAPFALLSAAISPDGTHLALTFNRAATLTGGAEGDVFLTGNFRNANGNGIDSVEPSAVVLMTLTISPIYSDETFTLAMPAGLFEDASGNPSPAYATFPVTNGSTVPGISRGLVADWHMDQASGTRANSASGGLYPLLQTGTVGSASGDIFALAATGFSASDYLRLASAGDLDSLFGGSTDLTIAVRCLASSSGSGFRMVCSKSGRFDLRISSGGAWQFTDTAAAGATGVPVYDVWSTVVAWYDHLAGTFSLQVDGGSVNTISSSPGGSGAVPLAVGVREDGFPWSGRIGPTLMWNRILTPGERADLFADLP